MLDTDELLKSVKNAADQIDALMDVVRANTAVFKDIRQDLSICNNQERVQNIINKVEKAMEDLSMTSQKIPPWVKEAPDLKNTAPTYGAIAYGQYPVDLPLNPDNPVLAPEDMPQLPSKKVDKK